MENTRSIILNAVMQILETSGWIFHKIEQPKGDPIQALKAELKKPFDPKHWLDDLRQYAWFNNLFQDRPGEKMPKYDPQKGPYDPKNPQATGSMFVKPNELSVDDFYSMPQKHQEKFAKETIKNALGHGDLIQQPSMAMKYLRDVDPNELLIHFTNAKNVDSIVQNGFRAGTDLMHLTASRVSNPNPEIGPYAFAFLLNGDEAKSILKGGSFLGKGAVVFKSNSGIVVDYPGDKYYRTQVIFDRTKTSDRKAATDEKQLLQPSAVSPPPS